MKTIKDFAIDYQKSKTLKEKNEVLNKLINIKKTTINGDLIEHIWFNDAKLNELLVKNYNKYHMIDKHDIDSFILQFLFEIDEDGNDNGMLNKIDLTKDPSQIINWIDIRLNGFLKNKIENELLFNENVISSNTVDENGNEIDLTDEFNYDEWIKNEYDESYNDYLDAVGGLDKVLTNRQLEMVKSTQFKSQKVVADELGVSEASVSRTLNQADKRLKKSYAGWRVANIIKKDEKGVLDEIKQFLKSLSMIANVDINGDFNYYDFTINWLKSVVKKDDDEIDMYELQKNEKEYTVNIYEAIVDNLSKRHFRVFNKVYNARIKELNSKDTITQREKETFSRAINQALFRYVEQVEVDIKSFLNEAIDNLGARNNEKMGRVKNNDYDKIIELLDA